MSTIFDFSRIKYDRNADKLFKNLLLLLDRKYGKDVPQWISIREISELIPKGTANIFNQSSYDYAMIALFGGQKERDYFKFMNQDIKNQFTHEANNTLRNNRFWRGFTDEQVQINRKYYLT